jgi:hypothetical protein
MAGAIGVMIVGVAAAAVLSSSGFGAARNYQALKSASDPHGYPRTFHLYGGGSVDELARYDFVVGYSWFPIAGMRTRNPNGIFLLQPGLNGDSVHVTAPGGAVGFAGARDSTRPKPLGSIRPVDPNKDFLHNADGSLAGGSAPGWNLAAPPAWGVPTEVANIFAYTAKQQGLYFGCKVRGKRVPCWNGVHSDNWIYSAIGASWFYGSNLDTNRDGAVDDSTSLHRNWSNGLTRVGTLLRSYLPGMIVGGNGAWYEPNNYAGSDPKGWLKASNYTMVEDMQTVPPATLLSAAKTWLNFADPLGQPRYMAVLQKATDINGNALLWTQGDPNTAASMDRPDVLRSMRWGLTLSLMTGVYYEIKGDFYGNGHDVRWWFDEYDGGVGIRRRGYLGQPLGSYTTPVTGVYRRDFQHGIAINNSSSRTQTIQLHGKFRKLKGIQDPSLNDGSLLHSVTVPAQDGIILLRS